jgi:response regulator RpfG family c-di-GMP phosphodiesterase
LLITAIFSFLFPIPYALFLSTAGVITLIISIIAFRLENDMHDDNKYLFYIIDDNPDILEIYCDKIQNMFDCKVLLFQSLEETVDKLDNPDTRPNVIICDVMMPTGSGFGIKEILKNKNLSIPVIFLTGLSGDNAKGSDLIILSKDISDAELKNTISKKLK